MSGSRASAGWRDALYEAAVPDSMRAALLRIAIERRPADAALHIELGGLAMRLRDYRTAASAFERVLALAERQDQAVTGLARSYRKLGLADRAVALCDDHPDPDNADWQLVRGEALLKASRAADGEAALRRALALQPGATAAKRLLVSVAKRGDGGELLAECEALPAGQRGTAGHRGYCALAYSLLGRTADAGALIDLDRCVMRIPFAPPLGFDGIETFNRRLADAILADPPAAPIKPGVHINYRPRTRDNAPLAALREFIRDAMAAYVADRDGFVAPAALPPAPNRALLSCGTVVLTQSGRNGQHIHPEGYLSAVYHVSVPDELAAGSDRGALALGACSDHAIGHQPSWGTRIVHAEAGWLTIFPSHVFHDVVPTGSAAPRISVVSDLEPADQP